MVLVAEQGGIILNLSNNLGIAPCNACSKHRTSSWPFYYGQIIISK